MRFSDMMGSGTEITESAEETDADPGTEHAPVPAAVLEAVLDAPAPAPVEVLVPAFAAAAISPVPPAPPASSSPSSPPIGGTALADFTPLSDDLLPRRR
jgi:hypothetical protein